MIAAPSVRHLAIQTRLITASSCRFTRSANCGLSLPRRRIFTPIMAESSSTSVLAQEPADPEIVRFQEHQSTAAKLSLAEEARTLVQAGTWGMLSTVGTGSLEGYPSGSVVEYAVDDKGCLIFAFSSMSSHTSEVKKHGRAGLTIPAANFKGLQDARVSLIGDIEAVPGSEVDSVKQIYRDRHPNSFWIDFGDFSIWRLSPKTGRLIGGFARAGQISAEQYFGAKPDPIAPYFGPAAQHMNADHQEATIAIVKHVAGITVQKADILTMDRLGMMVMCDRNGETFKARIPFSRPVDGPRMIKDIVVEMTKEAKRASR